MVEVLQFGVKGTETLKTCSELVLEDVFDNHLTGDGFLERSGILMLQNFVQILVSQHRSDLFLFKVILLFVFLPISNAGYLRLWSRMSLLMATFFMNSPKDP
jgi:hypothetical protein